MLNQLGCEEINNKIQDDETNIENQMQANQFTDKIVDYKHPLENKEYEYIDIACESSRTLILVRFKGQRYNTLYQIGERLSFIKNFQKKEQISSSTNYINKFEMDFEKLRIKNIFAKKQTSMFITEDNDIYIKGPSFFNFDDENFERICESFPEEIKQIDLGNEHVILLTGKIK